MILVLTHVLWAAALWFFFRPSAGEYATGLLLADIVLLGCAYVLRGDTGSRAALGAAGLVTLFGWPLAWGWML